MHEPEVYRPASSRALIARGGELLLDELVELRAGDVRYPGLLSGRGGVAYGLWRAGVAHRDRDLLQRALRWTELALEAHRRGPIWRPRPWSQFLGFTGYHFVRARIAHSLGDAPLHRASIAAFVDSAAHVIGRGTPDLYEGAAGCLAATAVLARERPDPALGALGGALLRVVLAELRRPRRRWSRYAGVAYGRGGLVLAAVEWSHATARPLPAWFWTRLAAMRDLPGPYFSPRNWCNGPRGLVAVWVRAHELTGDPQFLLAARETGREAAARPDPTPTLCCGEPGSAYGFLALERVDPGAGWRALAERSALAALAAEPDFPYRHRYGLTKGKTGVLCLALDLLTTPHAGVPAIQA